MAQQSNAESTQTVELDQTSVGRLSRIDALQQQQMALAAQKQQQTRLYQIDAALQRIEDDDYGYCIKTGNEIDLKRLEADPAAATCVKK